MQQYKMVFFGIYLNLIYLLIEKNLKTTSNVLGTVIFKRKVTAIHKNKRPCKSLRKRKFWSLSTEQTQCYEMSFLSIYTTQCGRENNHFLKQ